MIVEVLLLLIGIIILVKASNVVVERADIISQLTNVSSMFIGFIFIAIATSLPELAVNVTSSLYGKGNLGIATLFGSNVANITLVFGAMAFFGKYSIVGRDHKNMIEAIVLTSIIALFSLILGQISFVFGIFSFIIFFIFAHFIVAEGFTIGSTEKTITPTIEIVKNIIFILAAMAVVILSATLVTNSAVALAKLFNISESIIGVTIIAIGTSLPELVVSITAIKKMNIELAIGNIVGSLVANLTLILGLTAVMGTVIFDTVISTSIILLLIINIIFIYLMRREEFGITEGSILLFLYIIFISITGLIGLG